MKNKKGFTLIELLAVIIILGILMIIAIPSVTSYINDSRKNAYIDTAKVVVSGTRNLVNEGKLEMYDTNTTYYIPAKYVNTENSLKSPYGEFTDTSAYVGVIYDGTGYKYYWISSDDAGEGIPDITLVDKLDTDDIKSDLNPSDILDTIKITGIGNRTNIKILNTNGAWQDFNATNQVSEDGDKNSNQLSSAISTILENARSSGDITDDIGGGVYLFTGNNPANYVNINCYTDYYGTVNCQKWRIIGIYGNRLKIQSPSLITGIATSFKYRSIDSTTNAWIDSTLKTYLNTDFYETLSDDIKSMMDNTGTWYAGAISTTATAQEAYESAKKTTWRGIDTGEPGIGIRSYYEFLYSGRWLLDQHSWFISPDLDNPQNALFIIAYGDGFIQSGAVDQYQSLVVPSVYLKPTVSIISGDGTVNNPYVLG